MSNEEKNENLIELDSATGRLKRFIQATEPRLTEPSMFDMISNMSPLVSQRNSRITKSQINRALASLDDARDDLKSSELLLEGAVYSRSVFSLQQSVEKSCKALGLALGIIQKQKSIGHISPNVFIKMLEEQLSVDYFLPLLEQYTSEDQKGKIVHAKQALFSKDPKTLRQLLLLETKQLQNYLLVIESIKNQGAQQFKIELNKIQESLNVLLPEFEIRIDVLVDLMFCVSALFVLAVITFPHERNSRYSDTQIIHPKDYTKDMPLVAFLPRLQKATQLAIESLDRLIKNVKLQ